jgi:hypothetical protein
MMTTRIDRFHELSIASIVADPNKSFTMVAYTNDLRVLKNFVTNRYNFLTNHAELRPRPPSIVAVFDPVRRPTPTEVPFITAHVTPDGTNGIDSVWLYYRDKNFGRFSVSQMFDDSNHGDGAANDGIPPAPSRTPWPISSRTQLPRAPPSSSTNLWLPTPALCPIRRANMTTGSNCTTSPTSRWISPGGT